MPGDRGPVRYDMSRELRFEDPAHGRRYPGRRPSRRAASRKVTNLNQDLTGSGHPIQVGGPCPREFLAASPCRGQEGLASNSESHGGQRIDTGKLPFQSRQVIQRETDAVRWQLQPDFAPLLDNVLRSPGQLVKDSPVKEVTRHRLGTREFYIKRYLHHVVPLRTLKFFFKSSPARQEWHLAQQLETRGIPIVRHLALGERWTWRGLEESVLITEAFEGIPIAEAPEIDLKAVLRFVEQMLERGVLQKDLHPGNLLVRRAPFELRLVDLHGTRVQSRITAQERRQNLALLRVFLPVPVPPEIESISARLRKKLLYERSKRCLRHNREFTCRRFEKWKWQVRLPFLHDAVREILNDPDEFLKSRAHILKSGGTATVGKADGLVLKRFNFRKMQNLVKDLFRSSRARRAFRKAYHLELTGIPTARPVALAEQRVWGFLFRSYLLMEEISNALDLTTYFRKGCAPDTGLIRKAAHLIAKLHEEGFSHRDLKASNLLLAADGHLYLIDLDGLEFAGDVNAGRAEADLARLERSVAKYSTLKPRQRRLFLHTYRRARQLKRKIRAD